MASTFTLRILHISDTHFRSAEGLLPQERVQQVRAEQWKRYEVLKEAWSANLKEISQTGPVDLVCMTGDVADWGLPQEYKPATVFVRDLLSHFDLGADRFFIVPGNHDIDRSIESNAWSALRDAASQVSRPAFSAWMAGGRAPFGVDPSLREAVLKRNSAYREWVERTLQRPELLATRSPHGRLGYRVKLEFPGKPFPIYVIGLDSAFLAGDQNDAEKLLVTKDQAGMLTTDTEGSSLEGLRIALIHHPLEMLGDGPEIKPLLAKRVDLLLRGHQHKAASEMWAAPDSRLLMLAAGCLYEVVEGDDYPNAFQVIDISTNEHGHPLNYNIWFRSWSPKGHWYNDASIYSGAHNGKLSLPVDSKRTREAIPIPSHQTQDHTPQLTGRLENAPECSATLVGRQVQLDKGLALLRKHRLVSIVGMPGAGKTELVCAVAEAALKDASLCINQALYFAIAKREPEKLRRELEHHSLLREEAAHERRLLLVFDDDDGTLLTEDRRDAFVNLLRDLLGMHRHLKILVGSQAELGNSARGLSEQFIELSSLPLAEARSLFLTLAGRSQVEPAEERVLTTILTLLGGHPRSLVLGALQLKQDPDMKQMLKRLKRKGGADQLAIKALFGDHAAGEAKVKAEVERQVNSFNLAYKSLRDRSPEAADAFVWLGGLPAGLPAEMAREVLGEKAPTLLLTLRREHLVEGSRGQRITQIEPMRRYAAQRRKDLSSRLRKKLLDRTIKAYADRFSAAYEAHGTARAPAAIEFALAETPNIIKLSSHLAGVAPQPSHGVLFRAWGLLMLQTGESSKALPVLEQATENLKTTRQSAQWFKNIADIARGALGGQRRASNDEADKVLALLKETLGVLYIRTNQLSKAEQILTEALGLHHATKNRLGEADTLKALGGLHAQRSRLTEAADFYTRALGFYRELKSPQGVIDTRRSLGDLHLVKAQLAEAEQHYIEARNLYQGTEYLLEGAKVLRSLGELCVWRDQLDEAESLFKKSLELCNSVGDCQAQVDTLHALGDLTMRQARIEHAVRAYDQALELSIKAECPLGEAHIRRSLGEWHMTRGRSEEATKAYEQALALYRRAESPLGEAATLNSMGVLYRWRGKLDESERAFTDALAISKAIQHPLSHARALKELGGLHTLRGRKHESRRDLEEALRLYREVNYRLGEAFTLVALGHTLSHLGPLKEAENSLVEAHEVSRKIGTPIIEAEILYTKGELYSLEQKAEKGKAALEEALQQARALEYLYLEVSALKDLSWLYFEVDQQDSAGQALTQAVKLCQSAGFHWLETYLLAHLGLFLSWTERTAEAIKTLKKSIHIAQKTGNLWGEANSLSNLGDTYFELDQLDLARDYYARSLQLSQRVGSITASAKSLMSLGRTEGAMGLFQDAERSFSQSIELFRLAEDRGGESIALTGLGALKTAQGLSVVGYSMHLDAFFLARKHGCLIPGFHACIGMGRAALSAGRPELALFWSGQALEMPAFINDRRRQVDALKTVADSAAALKLPEESCILQLGWDHAVAINHPLKASFAEKFATLSQGAVPLSPLEDKQRAQFRHQLQEVLRARTELLARQGIDPEKPLSETTP
jgi:tetratricopeptide (TPR) repeat protein/3',5'-cyclic AMP phosphodiesterase CpdA